MLKNNWRGGGKKKERVRREKKDKVKEKTKKKKIETRFDAICDGRKKNFIPISFYINV